jgi:hypothetical protein
LSQQLVDAITDMRESDAQIDDGQEETIRAMVDFTKEYGVYR